MTNINIVIFGIGNVGSTLIQQLQNAKAQIETEQNIKIHIPVVVNSQLALFNSNQNDFKNWRTDLLTSGIPYQIKDVITYVQSNNLHNLIAVDATASEEFVSNYLKLISSGFHIVAANKIANTINLDFYEELRLTLDKHKKIFLYETNVGAGLPIVETVKRLYQSGEKITKIRGVFSGSLSYVFNRYSVEDKRFSEVLKDAVDNGFTEPDARDDLSGKDVARKLLILAREIGLKKEIDAVDVQTLVPSSLNGSTSVSQFQHRIHELDHVFKEAKEKQNSNNVLRYIGELDVEKKHMEVSLTSEPSEGDFGQLRGTDGLFEIYTESYTDRPLIIKGAGAGKEVTARGVLSDILKIARQL